MANRFLDVKDLGRLRANPDANDENLVRLPECEDCGATDPCVDFNGEDGHTVTGTATMTSVLIGGVTHAIPGSIQVQNTGALEAALGALLTELNEIHTSVTVRYIEGVLYIRHVGALAITSYITSASGTPVEMVRDCETIPAPAWDVEVE